MLGRPQNKITYPVLSAFCNSFLLTGANSDASLQSVSVCTMRILLVARQQHDPALRVIRGGPTSVWQLGHSYHVNVVKSLVSYTESHTVNTDHMIGMS